MRVVECGADVVDRPGRQVDREARGLGIEVVDVKIRRADLPEASAVEDTGGRIHRSAMVPDRSTTATVRRLGPHA